MKAFEVWINGEKKCVAGVSDEAFLHSDVLWLRDKPELNVGAIENEEHLRWLEKGGLELNVGDEVLIRIVETDVVDEPIGRSPTRTRADIEGEVRGHLTSALELLPSSTKENDAVSLALYQTHLAQNHLIGAVDALGALGERADVSAKFWRELANACHGLTQYDERDRYKKKFQAAKRQLDEASSLPIE